MSIEAVAALVKGVSGALGAAKAAGTVLGWLKGPGDDALRVAFRRTVGRYHDALPAIEAQLASFLESERVRERLQAATSTGNLADAGELAGLLVQAGDFYFPDEKEGMLLAREVIAFFLKAFDEEQLKGANALVYADSKRQADTQTILSALSSQGADVKGMFEQLMGAVAGPQLEQRVRTQKEYLKAKPPAEARAAWRAFEHELRTAGQWSPTIAWQVYTEIAVCSWQLGENEAAADEFEKAYAAKPDEELPSLNRALAFLIRGRVDDALAAADGVLAKSPENHRALSVKAQILHWVGRDEDAVEVLQPAVDRPDATGDELRLYAIACVKLGRYDSAVETGRRALSLDQARVQARNLLGIALLSRAQNDISQGRVGVSVTPQLEEAERLLVEAAEIARGESRTHDLTVALLNRANAVLALGRAEEAAELARQGWLASPDDTQASLAYGRMALVAGKAQQALAAVERLVTEGNVEAKITALLSFLSSAARKYDDIAEYADRLFPDKSELPTIVFQVLLDGALAERRVDAAKETELAWKNGSPAERALARARIAWALGDKAAATVELEAADSELKQTKEQAALFRLAETAAGLERLDVALATYDRLNLSPLVPSPMLPPFLAVLLQSPEPQHEERVLRMAAEARQAGVVQEALLEAEATVLENRGDVRAAAQMWRQLVERVPTNITAGLSLVRCLIRQNNLAAAKEALATVRVRPNTPPLAVLAIADMHRYVGDPLVALELAFEAWVRGRKDSRVLAHVITVFLSVPETERTLLRTDTVSDGTVAVLKFKNGPDLPVLVSSKEWKLGIERFMPHDEGGKRLLGLHAGETVEWGTGVGGTVTALIEEVLHPFVFAFREAIKVAPYAQPGTSPITAVSFGEGGKEFYEALVRQRADLDQRLAVLKASPAPFGLIARALGRDLFQTWSGVQSIEGLGFRAAFNTPVEREREAQALGAARQVLMDPTALMTCAFLETLARLPRSFERVVVTQQAYESFRESREHLVLMRDRSSGTIGVDQGRMFHTITPREEVEKAIAFIDGILQFCENHAELVGIPRALTPVEREQSDAIGEAFVATLAVADGRRDALTLYCDDAVLRELARAEYRLESFGTLAVMVSWRQQVLVTKEEVFGWTTNLLAAGYRSIPITPEYLTFLAGKPGSDGPYARAVDTCVGPDTEATSALGVVLAHLRQLTLAVSLWDVAVPYVDALLFRFKTRFGARGIERARELIRRSFVVAPANAVRLDDQLRRWAEVESERGPR